jgi:hypothetical protein
VGNARKPHKHAFQPGFPEQTLFDAPEKKTSTKHNKKSGSSLSVFAKKTATTSSIALAEKIEGCSRVSDADPPCVRRRGARMHLNLPL